MSVDLAEMLALELSGRSIKDGASESVDEFVVYHEKTRGMTLVELDKLMGEVEFIMYNRIIIQLKGN